MKDEHNDCAEEIIRTIHFKDSIVGIVRNINLG